MRFIEFICFKFVSMMEFCIMMKSHWLLQHQRLCEIWYSQRFLQNTGKHLQENTYQRPHSFYIQHFSIQMTHFLQIDCSCLNIFSSTFHIFSFQFCLIKKKCHKELYIKVVSIFLPIKLTYLSRNCMFFTY
jgi:hypothetical protein